MSVYKATDTLVLDFWWRLSKTGRILCLHSLLCVCYGSIRFTTGVTPPSGFLVASMATESLTLILEDLFGSIGGTQTMLSTIRRLWFGNMWDSFFHNIQQSVPHDSEPSYITYSSWCCEHLLVATTRSITDNVLQFNGSPKCLVLEPGVPLLLVIDFRVPL